MVGWLVGWLAGDRKRGWLVGWSFGDYYWSIDCIVGWLVTTSHAHLCAEMRGDTRRWRHRGSKICSPPMFARARACVCVCVCVAKVIGIGYCAVAIVLE